MTLSPAALEVARRHAAEDRDLLARLVAAGTVKREGPANALTRDIDRRVAAMRPGADTIRPNAKKAKAKRRRR